MNLVDALYWINGAFKGALTWTPTANHTIALPNATGTVLLDTTIVPLAEPRASTIRLGTLAGQSNTTGINWAAIGGSAGRYNSSGSNWTAIGASAGLSNTTGGEWAAIGVGAGQSNIGGSSWTAIGNSAGVSNTTGAGWTAIGAAAGLSNIGGSNWTAIGLVAGQNNNAGNNWTAIGAYTLFDTTTASSNTAVGFNTGRGITTGTGNSIFGASVTGLSATLTNNVILASGDGAIKLQINSSGQTSVSSFIATATTISTSTTTGSILTTGIGIGGGRGFFSLATSYDDSAAASQVNRSLYFNNGNTWAKRGDGSNVALSPLSLAAPVAAANVLTIPFDGIRTVLAQYNVSAPVTLTPATSRIQGSSTILVLSADGTNIPTLASGVRLFSDSATYSNVASTLHVYTFYELSGTVWVRISR